MAIGIPISAVVVSALGLWLALTSYGKQRVRSTIDYWVSTADLRFEARRVLPFEFDREDVQALCAGVQSLDHDVSTSSTEEMELRRQYVDGASAMGDEDRRLASRLEQRSLLYRYLSLIETLGAGIAAHAFSLKTVQLLDGPRLCEVWLAYGDLIVDWREANGDPGMYSGLELLAKELTAWSPAHSSS